MDANKKSSKEVIIREEDKNISLVDFLTVRFTYYSRRDWEQLIRNGNITLFEKRSDPQYQLVKGDKICFEFPDLKEPSVDSNFEIVYEDEFLFAINKSGNLPVHPAGRYQTKNLTTFLGNYIRELQTNFKPSFYIVNRIDRETSGIVLFGKDKKTTSLLNGLFSDHRIKKTYIVFVEGSFPSQLVAEGYLTRDKMSNIRKKKHFNEEIVDEEYCYVKTEFIKIDEQSNISKLFAFPITGKIHQIRATLYSKGFPVVGDKIYGNDENVFLDFIVHGDDILKGIIKRQALHSYRLEFIHPITKKMIEITAPEPKDMQNIFQR